LGWYRLDSRIRGGFPVSLLRSVPRIAAISGDKPGSPKGGHSMSRQYFDDAYRGSPPQNYERYFVPAIGAPAARGLMGIAALRPGERVLDVACGTGVVARLAAEAVGGSGTVAGLDINPGMLMVARSSVPAGMTIEWHEAGAESMPFADAAFDA